METREEVMVNSSPVCRMTVYNVPEGSQEFVEGYLEQRMQNILKGYTKFGELLDPRR